MLLQRFEAYCPLCQDNVLLSVSVTEFRTRAETLCETFQCGGASILSLISFFSFPIAT